MTEEAEKTATHESYGAGWTKVSLIVPTLVSVDTLKTGTLMRQRI
jgi:hypothetical protein